MSDVLIEAENVGKKFCRDLKKSLWYGVKDSVNALVGRSNQSESLRPNEFWANHGISFELQRGECLGLVGRNGAGKTTLLKMVGGLISPDQGTIKTRGALGALIALGAGFNPVLTGRENVYINGAILGLSKRQVKNRLEEILDFAELEDFIDAPVQSYSSGMRVRLGFAVAAVLVQPDVLLLDEVLAVGDRAFRIKCMTKISDLLRSSAVIFVSHQMSQVSKICTHAPLMRKGQVLMSGTPLDVIAEYESDTATQEVEVFAADGFRITSYDVDRTEIGFGDSITLDLIFQSETNMGGAFLRVHVLDSAGDSLMEWDSRNHIPNLEIKEGQNRISAELSDVRLCQGDYYLSFALNDRAGVEYLIAANRCRRFISQTEHLGVCRVQL